MEQSQPANRWRGFLFAILLVSASVVASAGQGSQTPAAATQVDLKHDPTAGSSYVGSDTCATCHEDISKQHFNNTPHAKLAKLNKHGCEDCHGPGSAHIEGGGDKSKIFSFKSATLADINKRCLNCHGETREHGNWSRGMHATSGVSCIQCHSPHYAKTQQALLIQSTPGLCYGCHTQQKADFSKPFRHRVNEGLVQCQDCHNVHGAFERHNLRRTDSNEEVCYKCHRDKQGPFAFEHPPIKLEGCTSCHTPHGSANARLLRVTPVNVLCMQCHTPAFNTASPGIPSFHNQTQKYQSCTMCHSAIHGSNAVETFEY